MLAIAPVRTDADLEAMIRVQVLVRPDWQPKLENLRHNLESNPDLSYFVVRLDEMYAIAVQADDDIPGSAGRQSYERWRAMDIDRPNCLPELCFVALAEDEVVGYAFLQASGERAFHGLTATRRDWRRKGVA